MVFTDLLDDDELYLSEEELLTLTDEELAAYLKIVGECQALEGGWSLQPRQQTAEDRCNELMAKGEVFELLYGGAGAGGKSEWLLWHLHHLALTFPGFKGLLIRRTYTELKRTAIDRSLGRFDRSRCRYMVTDKRWIFDNGSIIEFGFCETDRDVYQYDSAEYACVAWDELTQFPTDGPYRYLFSRLRVTVAQSIRGLTPHVIAGTNPHRTGVVWVKPRWVEIGPAEVIHDVPTVLEDGSERNVARVFIPAKMSDNRFVNQAQYRNALSLLDDATRKAIEDGSWDVVEGQYFTEWDRALHVVRPFTIPGHWKRIGGLDFGISAPFAHEWVAFDGDGNAFVYREAYRRELTPLQQVQLILGNEGPDELISYRMADPSIWTRTGAGPPIASQYIAAGMPVRKANNARVDGWARMRDYLRPSVPVDDGNGGTRLAPKLFIFDTCRDLVRTLPMLVHDEKKPEDVDTDGEDHAPDALRYALMSVAPRTRTPVAEPDVRLDIARALPRTPSGYMDHPDLGRIPI